MRYDKPPLTFTVQADRLITRGLQADRDTLIARLQAVSYYRLSAYLYPFRVPESDTFQTGTTFDLVWKHYTFDRQLRILLMDAIERVEVAVRTQLIYHHSHAHGPFGYLDGANLPGMDDPTDFYNWIEDLKKEAKRSRRESFLEHFYTKYGDSHSMPPIWMLAEVMSFGKMLTYFNGVDYTIRQQIARAYGIDERVLRSWVGALNIIRNICAHHGRLWNRELGYKPLIPRSPRTPQWYNPVTIPNNRIFGILTILKYLLDTIAPSSHWAGRFHELLHRYPEVPIAPMGFPADWEKCPIWSIS